MTSDSRAGILQEQMARQAGLPGEIGQQGLALAFLHAQRAQELAPVADWHDCVDCGNGREAVCGRRDGRWVFAGSRDASRASKEAPVRSQTCARRASVPSARTTAICCSVSSLAMVCAMRSDTDETLSTLRDLSRGIYPPLLADQGLVTALTARVATGRTLKRRPTSAASRRWKMRPSIRRRPRSVFG